MDWGLCVAVTRGHEASMKGKGNGWGEEEERRRRGERCVGTDGSGTEEVMRSEKNWDIRERDFYSPLIRPTSMIFCFEHLVHLSRNLGEPEGLRGSFWHLISPRLPRQIPHLSLHKVEPNRSSRCNAQSRFEEASFASFASASPFESSICFTIALYCRSGEYHF